MALPLLQVSLIHLRAVQGGDDIALLRRPDQPNGPLEEVAPPEGQDEGDHADDGQDGEDDLRVLPEPVEGIKGHVRCSLWLAPSRRLPSLPPPLAGEGWGGGRGLRPPTPRGEGEDLPARPPPAGLDTRQKGIVWVKGVLRSNCGL